MAWSNWFSYSAIGDAAYHQHDLGISCAISGCSSDDTQVALRISQHLIVVVKESLACIIYERGGNRVNPVWENFVAVSVATKNPHFTGRKHSRLHIQLSAELLDQVQEDDLEEQPWKWGGDERDDEHKATVSKG